ncbi:hypothetical protein EVG20_g6247 [Dentipellis fragilis]|uniref:Metaxin glutathione S-transferase domain-containing protein n=1 Tax=Dentipellis fragilis TaxID=205917 RepID=A0A4Y9YPH3_9AGAM|nr:hypothetical protein EVG20_g6247 [Dentipellis fragilis]
MSSSTAPTAPTRTSYLPPVPKPLAKFFSLFPLYTFPAQPPPNKHSVTAPTLWIHPPPGSPHSRELLSADVECLKWQAGCARRSPAQSPYASPRAPDGDGELLPSHNIPAWVDERVGLLNELEGYRNVEARDESHAWVALLEGDVHAALALSQPPPSFFFQTILQLPSGHATRPIETLVTPPPAPLSGISSLMPPYGSHIPVATIKSKYRDAIASLSERLGTEKWFLGSEGPTALDALAFAYIHALLHAPDDLRIEVARRVNLVTWEHRVYELVRTAFVPHATSTAVHLPKQS